MTELMLAAALVAVLILSFGLIGLLWQAIGALRDQARLLVEVFGKQLAPVSIPPIGPVVVPRAVPPATPAPAAPPAPAGPYADYPAWFRRALSEIGFHETGNNQGIEKYIALAHCGAVGQPWCAIFANAMLEASGVPGTRSPSSQSFRSDPNFVALAGPAKGAIVVFWRIARGSGQGHVGFYVGEDDSRIWTLGGNENDMVQIEALPKDSASFGLIGYWWPKGVPLPQIGAVTMPAGSPVQVQSPPAGASSAPALAASATSMQTNIVATVWGDDGKPGAYGFRIDNNKNAVALPFRFEGPRPQVRVTNVHTGLSVIADIDDVGPWNTHDDYWARGARPQAETGIDTRGRKTSDAGIDLTPATANAIQIDGKGLVDWEFLPVPQPVAAAIVAAPTVS